MINWSLCKILHKRDWFEGPNLDSPLSLMKSTPCGQSQRYQIENHQTYFCRWVNHVSSAYIASIKSKNIVCINYKNLLNNYLDTFKNLCNELSLEIINSPEIPKKNNFIRGVDSLEISEEVRLKMNEYCKNEFKKYNDLPRDIYIS